MKLLHCTACALAMVASATATSAQQTAIDRSLRVFLDCNSCDDDYVRTETRWAEFVRDRTAADVHVLVTSIGTGAGGDELTIQLIGLGTFAARSDTLRVNTSPTQTESERRDFLTRAIHLGLAPFAALTPAAARLRLSLGGADDETEERGNPAGDPWKAWVFEVGLNGSIDREQRQRSSEIGGSFEASRITPAWKFGFEFDGEQNQDRFDLEDRRVTSTRESYDADAIAVRSLGAHWGSGVQLSLSSSTFENTKRAVRSGVAVEYSLWPYQQATSRQLTMQYSAGVSSFVYREETIFRRLRETRPTQAFVVGYDVRQPWGEAEATFEYANYLDDFEQYRLEFDASASFRIVRGLELELGASASQIRDQLSVARRDATDEEILLELRDLRTDYRLNAFIGFNFTFGSIFNSVVNPRFGGGPGQIF
jgi:hypothetical protein